MSIFGIGTDIMQLSRIEKVWRRFGDRFARHILAPIEWEEYTTTKNPIAFLAKRFAAKEATAKALGIGFREGILLKDIAVYHDSYGKPQLQFYHKVASVVSDAGITQSNISISDEREYAVAFVILVK